MNQARPAMMSPSLRLARRLRLLKRRLVRAIGRGEKRVRITLHQTAELRMIRSLDGHHFEPLVFDCPICTERDRTDTKLLMVELRTVSKHAERGWIHRRPNRRVQMLLRLDRDQFERIGADFSRSRRDGIKKNFGPDRPDREMVLDSLVP